MASLLSCGDEECLDLILDPLMVEVLFRLPCARAREWEGQGKKEKKRDISTQRQQLGYDGTCNEEREEQLDQYSSLLSGSPCVDCTQQDAKTQRRKRRLGGCARACAMD
jgi:hypothetical protein